MAHVRADLRAALKATLAGLATPANVYAERRRRLGVEELPAVIFMVGEETPATDERSMGYTIERETTITFELHAAGFEGEPVADLLDQMDLEIEQALEASWEAWSLITILTPGEQSVEYNDELEQVHGVRTITWIGTWRAKFGAPDSAEV